MATQAQHSYRIAKQKAAKRLGINTRLALPSNREVENALRAYQGFYGGQGHLRQIQTLREVALRVMESLTRFNPRLVGPVLDGTADKHTKISIQVFNDPPDMVALHLMEKGLIYTHDQRKIRWYDGSFRDVPLLIADADGTTVELALFSCVDLHQAPPSPIDGRPQRRASVSELEILIAESSAGVA